MGVKSYDIFFQQLACSAEAGYGYILSARDVDPGKPHGLLASLSYGYVVHEKPKSMTALSLVLGYDMFPRGDGPGALYAMVYSVEYAHTFFRQKPVSLLLDYGLLTQRPQLNG